MAKSDLTIIILTYNTLDVTDECLRRVSNSAAHCVKVLGNRVSTIVVDNGSSDGTVGMIRKKYPLVKLMVQKENLGYARGNNLALEKTETPFILLLNSDAYLEKDTLVKSLDYLEKNTTCDALCVRLIYPDGSFQPYGGNLPTPFRTICWALGLESLPVVNRFIRPVYQYHPGFFKLERQMEWCSTGFFLLRKKVYDLTGGFDSGLFLYMEDVEWCQRIMNNHMLINYVPWISIIHLGGFTSKQRPESELLKRHLDGLLYFHKVHYPATFSLVSRFISLGMSIRSGFFSLKGQPEKARVYKNSIGEIYHTV